MSARHFASASRIAVKALDHLVLNVRDVEASASWYVRVLGMSRKQTPASNGPRTSVHFGVQKMNLRPISTSQADWFTARVPANGSDDLCFLVDSPPSAVVAHLKAEGVPVELGPLTRHGAQGEIMSVYCRDPDGNLIEISSYPE